LAKIRGMSTKSFLVRSALAVLALLVIAACSPATPKFAYKAAERRGRLQSNGLRFVVMPDPTTQLVEVDVRYEVGSREDPDNKAGLAHLVEHLMFQQKPDGPETKPLMHFISQTSIGMNAYTNWDTTHYMTEARADQVDTLIKVEAMRMYFGCQTISQQEFEREREVVRNEIRARARTPEGQIPPLVLQAVYPKGHAYQNMIGGDDQQLSNATLEDACKFMRDYYVPERATIIIAGGVQIESTVASIQKWFGNLEKRPGAARRKVEPVQASFEKKTIDLDLERPWVAVAWPMPDGTTPEGEAAEFGIWGAFLDTAVKANRYECATQVQPAVLGGQEAPVFLIALELKSMSKLDECLEFVWQAAHNASRGYDDGTWAQLEEFKNRRQADFIARMEPLFPFGRTNVIGDMVQFDKSFDFDSSELYVFHALDKIANFDMPTVGKVVRKVLDKDRARVVVFKPNKEGIKGDSRSKLVFQTKSHDQMEQPEVDPREAKRPLKVSTELNGLAAATRFQLDNGMNVVLLPIDAMPLVAVQLVFNAGDAVSPDNPVLASAAAGFLSEPLDAEATRRAGISLDCGTTPDHTICGTRGVNIYLDVMLKGLERLVKAGVYSQEQIENWQKSTKIRFQLRRPQQQLEFQRQQLTAIFGPDHPYTRTGVLLPDDVGKIGRDALTSFRNKHYSAQNATLIVAGAFDLAKGEALVRSTFGGWGKGHKDEPVAATPSQRTGPAFVGVVGEDEPQMDVVIMYPAPAGVDGQEAARRVLTAMLNDKMWDIRAKLGATYGTYAGRDTRLGPSVYEMGGAVDTPRAGEAIKGMRDGIDSLRTGVDFDVAFVRARRKIVAQLLGESTMSAELAGRLGQIARFHLDGKFYNQLLQQVAAVSPAQVKALIKSELDPANEVLVTMGTRDALTKAFAGAGIADVKIVEPEYK
jgi:zinc protease